MLENTISCLLEAEELATEVSRRCERCVGCSRCEFRTQEISRKEQEELRLLQENAVHDVKNKCVRVTYPLIGDASRLKDNRYQVKRMTANY